MSHKIALQIIFVIAIAGLLFSGFLSYQTLFTTDYTLVSTIRESGKFLGVTVCVCGFLCIINIFSQQD